MCGINNGTFYIKMGGLRQLDVASLYAERTALKTEKEGCSNLSKQTWVKLRVYSNLITKVKEVLKAGFRIIHFVLYFLLDLVQQLPF